MEIPPSRWSTAGRQRGARPYPKNELREPALGCAAYPRRASEARLRRRPVDSLEVVWSKYWSEASISSIENLIALITVPVPHRLSLIHISEPTRLGMGSYAVFCLRRTA